MKKIFLIIKNHVTNNKKEYFIICLLFLLGIFLGDLFVNQIGELEKADISNYINNFTEKLKNTENINYMDLLKNSIIQNLTLGIILWFFGTTVIGLPVVFGIILYRGFCLGYTISSCVGIFGLTKGIIFILVLLLLQNIMFIPAIIALGVSGFKLYKSIVKDRNRDNIKIEVIRHSLFSSIMIIVLIISSIIEIFVSTGCLKFFIKYF